MVRKNWNVREHTRSRDTEERTFKVKPACMEDVRKHSPEEFVRVKDKVFVVEEI